MGDVINEDGSREELKNSREVMADAKIKSASTGDETSHSDLIWTNRVKSKQKNNTEVFGRKVYVTRKSVLTVMYGNRHINTLYNLFVVMAFYLLLQNIIGNYSANDVINFGQKTIKYGMGGFSKAVGIWLVMQTASTLVYFALKLWMDIHDCIKTGKSYRRLWDIMSLLVYIVFLTVFIISTSYAAASANLGFGSCLAVLMEMTRFVMKIHAFVRTNVPRILSLDHQHHARYPYLSQYIYFLFAPTLLYRDEYPRTSEINWRFAFCRLVEFASAILFIANLYEVHIRPHHQDFGKVSTTINELLTKFCALVLPTICLFFVFHYMLWHAWMNLTGELMRFGDRMFYKDWWNSFNFHCFFPNWNIVVHDWLYEYIYKDLYTYVFLGSAEASKLGVFVISIIFHELLMVLSVRFFLPVFVLLFGGCGVVMIHLTKRLGPGFGGMFFWLSFCLGTVQLLNYYFVEYYARQNCPLDNSSWLNSFKLVSLHCNGLS